MTKSKPAVEPTPRYSNPLFADKQRRNNLLGLRRYLLCIRVEMLEDKIFPHWSMVEDAAEVARLAAEAEERITSMITKYNAWLENTTMKRFWKTIRVHVAADYRMKRDWNSEQGCGCAVCKTGQKTGR